MYSEGSWRKEVEKTKFKTVNFKLLAEIKPLTSTSIEVCAFLHT